MDVGRRAMDGAKQDNIPDYLRQLLTSGVGWGGNDPLPKLNDENQTLLEEILEINQSFVESNNILEKNMKERLEIEQHVQTVKETNQNTTALIKVKESELEIENHLNTLKEGNNAHLTQNSTKMEKELQTFTDRKQKLEECISNAKQKLEDFRLQKNWDQKTLEDFLKESAQKHEDTMALIKYAHQDKVKINSLTLAIEKESMCVSNQRETLDNAMAENKFSRTAFNKATENLQQTLKENQQLANHWENNISQLTQRAAETQECVQILSQTRQEIRERISTINDCKHLLDTQRNNNREMANRLTIAKQLAKDLKQKLETEEGNCQMLQLELQTCVHELDRATTEKKTVRAGISQMKNKLAKNQDRLRQADSDNAALEGRLRALTQKTLSEEESAAQMDQFLMDEEQVVKDLEVQLIDRIRELKRCEQHFEDVKSRKKTLTLQVSECISYTKILGKNRNKLEEKQMRLEKITFQQESEVEALAITLARLQGNVSSNERQMMETKIAKLKKDLEEKEKSTKSLTKDIRKLEHHNRLMNKEKEKLEARKANLTNKNSKIFLLTDLKEKELISLRLMNQEKRMKIQITKAETQRLSDWVHNRTESMHFSKMRKLDLQRTMKEREMEMTAQKQILSRQLHITDQERHELRLQLNVKLQELHVKKNRCVILVSYIGPEMEPKKAQAYYIVQFEQEKEELRQQRDALDSTIQKVVLENGALENTNQLWQDRTSSLRKSLNRVDGTNPEYQEKLKLEEQLKAFQDVLRSKTRKLQELQGDIQEKEEDLGSMQQAQQEEKKGMEVKERLMAKLQKQACSHQESINRHNKHCSTLTKQIRKAKSTQEETLEEKDIRLRWRREFSRKLDKMLSEVMESSPDLTSALNRRFLEANVPLPTPTQSSQHKSRSSFLSSPASSVVSSRGSSSSCTAALKTDIRVVHIHYDKKELK